MFAGIIILSFSLKTEIYIAPTDMQFLTNLPLSISCLPVNHELQFYVALSTCIKQKSVEN